MGRYIFVVVAIMASLAYCAVFQSWNATTKVTIITWNALTPPMWIPDVPVGLLTIIAAAIGGFVVAVGAWLPWTSQRRISRDADAKLRKAIARYQEQKAVLQERDEKIASLEAEVQRLSASPEAESEAGAVHQPEVEVEPAAVTELSVAPSAPRKPAPPEEEEVI